MKAYEINFDGLVGPTHNYAGLSYGNVASMANRALVSNPKRAALQGLAKMKFLADLGITQAVLPPHERPHVATLRRLGFNGSDGQVLEAAHRADPMLIATVSSSSSMWAANAATVSPSADCADAVPILTNIRDNTARKTVIRDMRSPFRDAFWGRDRFLGPRRNATDHSLTASKINEFPGASTAIVERLKRWMSCGFEGVSRSLADK